ncbi:MAG: HD family phosphohydrolase [Saprospiraceae bacterium]
MKLRTRMRRFWNDLPTWAQVGMVLGVIVLISFMFPTSIKFDYSYEQGQRWKYDDLIAPFDFPIQKTFLELETEQTEILESKDPYFLFDDATVYQEQAAFEASFQAQFQGLGADADFPDLRQRPNVYLAAGSKLLSDIYATGVVAPDEALENPRNGIVNIVKGHTIIEQTPGSLLNVAKARDRISGQLKRLRLGDVAYLLPLVQQSIHPNVFYSDSLTNRFVDAQLAQIVTSKGMVKQGELIVTDDGIITDDIFRKLESYKQQYESAVVDDARGWLMFLGHLMLTSLIMAVLLLYIRMFHPGEFSKFNRLVFILILVLATSFAVYRIESFNTLSIYLLPLAIVPIVIKNFYQPGIALFTHLVIVLIASFLSSLGYEFTFLQIVAGIVAVLSPTGPRDWSKILRSMGILAATYVLGYIGLELIKEGNWRAIDWTMLTWLGLNVFLTLLAYPLVPLLGRLFGFTSDVVLLELSDVNRPALTELGLRAPGTLQHSLAVSNLAEAAVRKIGGDTLLVKVAALYHDIGKTVEPEYFIENQAGRNPHDDLSPLESAQVIINHIPEGVRLAKKYGLPTVIIDFISSHHGTTRVEYFYRAYAKTQPEGTIDDSAFRYPGPLPKSKEEGVLMIADSVEAAGRAMKDPTHEGIENLVDAIVEGKVKNGQLNNCDLTFAELQQVRELFKGMLKSMYHARVEYPEEEE